MNLRPAITAAMALTWSCFGSTAVTVGKQDVTAMQAIVRVQTDQGGFCTYRVSEGSSFTALVNDVNPNLFSGANLDARPGSVVTGIESSEFPQFAKGSEHVFVAGTRTAGVALDGRRYSRALQANTLHWVGVTCGADAEASTTFTTLNPPVGNNGPEQMPFDSTAFGNVAVPTISWTNRAAVYNDPITGLQLRRMTDPADYGFYSAGDLFTYAISGNGHWSNPNNALSAGSSSLATCDPTLSCTASDALVLVAEIPYNVTNFKTNGAWDPSVSFHDFLVQIWGSGTDASAANRTVAVCWSIDDQTCFTSSQNVVLPQTTAAFAGTAPPSWSVQAPWSAGAATRLTNIVVSGGAATVNFAASPGLSAGQQICINGIRNQSVSTGPGGNGLNGCHTITGTGLNRASFATNASPGTYTDSELIASPGFPQAVWASWGTPPLHSSVGQRGGGTVTATAGALALTSSGSPSSFDLNWTNGTKILINGSAPACTNNLCTVASVTDTTDLTLMENLTISNASWTSANFALLIKKTTNTGAVSVSAGYNFVYSTTYNTNLDGSGDICNSNTVTIGVDADGNAISPVSGYLCTASSSGVGTGQPIYAFIPATGETRLLARGFNPAISSYRAWVGWHPTQGNCFFTFFPGQSVFQTCYGGDYRALTPGFIQNPDESATPEQLTFTDIFGGSGNDMPTQIANCAASGKCPSSGINSSLFIVPPVPPQTGSAVRGSYLFMGAGAINGPRDSPGYITMWNITSLPAKLAWANYTFTQFPVGYAGIHAIINFGNGQFNAASLNGSSGQNSSTAFSGPWQQAPIMYDATGTGYVSNTSVQQTDGFQCPAGLDARWQALGAKPVSQGGVARCLKFKVPGDFCSIHASPAEAAAFPCPWNPNYSLIKAIGEGDEVGDAAIGFASFGEKMLVVQVTRNSSQDIDLLVFRYSQQSQTPNSGFTCGSYAPSEWNHSNGWTMWAMPFYACPGSNYWINAQDNTFSYVAENNALVGGHADFGQGSSGYTYVESGYVIRANQPMPGQIGQPPTNNVSANPTFGSAQLPDTYLQSYPSKRQDRAVAPASEMDWALDVRSYNPGVGQGAEALEGLFGNVVSLVPGHTQTYLISFPGNQTPDPKITGFVGWAGYHMLADASGPNSAGSFGDLTPWRYCYAFAGGECIAGSTVGQIYISVPQEQTSSQCLVNTYAYNASCISNNYPYGFWTTQFNTTVTDSLGTQSRRLTSALVAPGRQYNFTNAKPTPDGKWAQVMASWLEGQRTDLLWVKLPPWLGTTSNPGTAPGATQLKLQLNGTAGDTVRAAFGYAENGAPASFYCTTRAETCYTSAAATPQSPFVYAGQPQSYVSCSQNCEVQIPAVPGRILYYQVQRQNGLNNRASAIGVVAVQ